MGCWFIPKDYLLATASLPGNKLGSLIHMMQFYLWKLGSKHHLGRSAYTATWTTDSVNRTDCPFSVTGVIYWIVISTIYWVRIIKNMFARLRSNMTTLVCAKTFCRHHSEVYCFWSTEFLSFITYELVSPRSAWFPTRDGRDWLID